MHLKLWTWLRATSSGLQILAVLIGLGAGAGAAGFRWLILTMTRIFTGHDDYSLAGGTGSAHLPWLGPWFVVVTPAAAGLLYGPLVYAFAREAR